jgi:hypothetical protein
MRRLRIGGRSCSPRPDGALAYLAAQDCQPTRASVSAPTGSTRRTMLPAPHDRAHESARCVRIRVTVRPTVSPRFALGGTSRNCPRLARSHGTELAHSLGQTSAHEIVSVEKMTADTPRFPGVHCRRTDTSENVLADGHPLHVGRIDTTAIAAKVVVDQSFRERTANYLHDPHMRQPGSFSPEQSVAVLISDGNPLPTPIRPHLNLVEEAPHGGLNRSTHAGTFPFRWHSGSFLFAGEGAGVLASGRF